jgi:hypothetical protein
LLFKAPDAHTLHAHFEQNRAEVADRVADRHGGRTVEIEALPPKKEKGRKVTAVVPYFVRLLTVVIGDPVAPISQTDHIIFLEKIVEDLKTDIGKLQERLRSNQLEKQESDARSAYFNRASNQFQHPTIPADSPLQNVSHNSTFNVRGSASQDCIGQSACNPRRAISFHK